MTIEMNSHTTVTDAQLAAIVGVEPRQIRRYAEAGTIQKEGRNSYNLADAVQALMAEAAGSGSALTRARTRKVEAEAVMAELELARQRGEVASISDFERVQAARYAVIRQNVVNVAQRAALQLLGETREDVFKEKLRKELTLALKTAAEAKLHLQEDEAPNA